MDTSNALFVGVKGHVAAFSKHDGSLIWKTQLKGAFLSVGDRFVTVLVEGQRIYAHSHGELFCLEAATGQQLWTNKLEGLGYDIASLAIEGAAASSQAALARYQRSKDSGGDGGGDGGD